MDRRRPPPLHPRRVHTPALGLAVGSVLAAGCIGAVGCGGEPADRHLVAVVVDLSGPGRAHGMQIRDGTRLALREARARTGGDGGTPSAELEFLIQDDRGDPARAARLARILRGVPEVMAVIGPGDLPSAAAALPEYGRGGVSTLVPASLPRELTRDRPWAFAMAPAPDYLGETLAWFLVTELQVDSAATFFSGDLYGRSLERGFTAELEQLGAGVLVRVPFDSTLARLELFLGDALSAGALLVAAPEGLGSRLVGALRAGGVAQPVLAGAALDGAALDVKASEDDLGGAPGEGTAREVAGGVFYPVLFDPGASQEARRFASGFTRAFGRPPAPEAALAYDAASLVLAAIEAGVAGRDELREHLAAAGTGAPHRGVTGSFFFTLEHDAVRDVAIAATGATGPVATRRAGALAPAR